MELGSNGDFDDLAGFHGLEDLGQGLERCLAANQVVEGKDAAG